MKTLGWIGMLVLVFTAGFAAQSSNGALLASVDVRQMEGKAPVLVLTASGPLAWKVLEPLPGDPPAVLRLKIYGVRRGDVAEALETPLGPLALVDDRHGNVLLALAPSHAGGTRWQVRLGRDANIVEIERR